METRKVYLRPSATSLLEGAPAQVGSLLAQYLKLIDSYAQKEEVAATRTEVSGYEDREDGSQRLLITHRVGLPAEEMRGYRSQLGMVIQEWVSGLSSEDRELLQQWFVLEVVPASAA